MNRYKLADVIVNAVLSLAFLGVIGFGCGILAGWWG
jgi:hypothetical protein